MRHYAATTAGVLLALALASCGPQLAEEQARFRERIATARSLIRAYPAYRSHLISAIRRANRTRRMAGLVRDPEKSAELLARANRELQPRTVQELGLIAPRLRHLNRIGRSLRALKLAPSDEERARNMSNKIRSTVREAYRTLGEADPNEEHKALRAAQAVNRRLEEQLEQSERLLKQLEARERLRNSARE